VPQPAAGTGTGSTTTQTGTAGASGAKGGGTTDPKNTGGSAGGSAGVDYQAKFTDADKKRKDAEKERDQLREAIEQHQRAANTETENLKADFEKLEAKEAAFEEFKYTTFLELAIMKDGNYSWHDVEDVRAALEKLDVIKIDDDGNIEGLEDGLKTVAEKKPHLLKPAGQPNVAGAPPNLTVVTDPPSHDGPSGSQPGGSPGGNADFDEAALKKKYKIG